VCNALPSIKRKSTALAPVKPDSKGGESSTEAETKPVKAKGIPKKPFPAHLLADLCVSPALAVDWI
jgi:hypothetical protein